MRQNISFCTGWQFIRGDGDYAANFENAAQWQSVTLPHTWNVDDGQSTANYYRGICWYRKVFETPELQNGQRAVLKFEAVQHIAEVFCNGQWLAAHQGGYSTFFVDLTSSLVRGENVLAVRVDNLAEHIYPQMADFTFFGGIYRPVTLLILEQNHFSLEKSGSDGVFILPKNDGRVRVDAYVSGGSTVTVTLLDQLGHPLTQGSAAPVNSLAGLDLTVDQPHPWQGVKDPYLYSAVVALDTADELTIRFGFRDFSVDPERGVTLNGIATPLRGVNRHQDRENMGTAITAKEHAEDIALILEMGANSVRLAHYQHAQAFYDLCDETGLVVWAEIPFISLFDPSPESRANTLSQMQELVLQNYNHTAIFFWGIANELGMGGESEALMANLRELNDLCHRLDPSRLTTIANVSMTPTGSAMCQISDVLGYNQYLGWYSGKIEDWGPWLDQVHAQLPGRGLSLSEYGAESVLGWHSDAPRVHDYTEEYQALVHEGALQAISQRDYLWGTFVWNMFDFASARRDEGGCKGRNNKGLVTFDRKIKKDAFFLYKAYFSSQPFVHITGRRYGQRPQESISLKIYSNCPRVMLSVNGGPRFSQNGDKIFRFENVPLEMGKNTLVATAANGALDVIELERVAAPNPAYVYVEPTVEISAEVKQWFANLIPQQDELLFPEGYCSVEDELGSLLAIPEAQAALEELLFKPLDLVQSAGATEGLRNELEKIKSLKVRMIYRFMAAKHLPKKALVLLNERLNQVKKTES
jgi:beta-galactosidase